MFGKAITPTVVLIIKRIFPDLGNSGLHTFYNGFCNIQSVGCAGPFRVETRIEKDIELSRFFIFEISENFVFRDIREKQYRPAQVLSFKKYMTILSRMKWPV